MTMWERIKYRLRMIRLGLTMMPMAGADDEGDGEDAETGESGGGEGGESGDAAEPKSDDGEEGESSGGGESDGPYDREGESKKTAEDYRRELRRQDTMAKRTAKENRELKERLAKLEDKNKSDQERAIEKARREGQEEATKEADAVRREDRLESASIRIAAKGLRIEVDDKMETFRFADPDDAKLHLDRAIKSGDIDRDDLFDEGGKVRTEPLAEALREILTEKPYLRAGGTPPGKTPKPEGSANGGKGSGDEKTDLEDMSVDEHYQRIRRGPDKVESK